MTTDVPQPVEVRSQPAQHPPVILLVEDESIVPEVTREVLVHAGYSVMESGTPAEALEIASGHPGTIDLLLTDMVMPGMNGTELAARVQRLRPGMVTVFMSGYAESDTVERIRQSSAIHIQKPFTVKILLSRIDEALQVEAAAG